MKRIIALTTALLIVMVVAMTGCSNTGETKPADSKPAGTEPADTSSENNEVEEMTKVAEDFAKAMFTVEAASMTGTEGSEYLTKSFSEEYVKGAEDRKNELKVPGIESRKFTALEYRTSWDEQDVKKYYCNVTVEETPSSSAGYGLTLDLVKEDGNWKINGVEASRN